MGGIAVTDSLYKEERDRESPRSERSGSHTALASVEVD